MKRIVALLLLLVAIDSHGAGAGAGGKEKTCLPPHVTKGICKKGDIIVFHDNPFRIRKWCDFDKTIVVMGQGTSFLAYCQYLGYERKSR